MFEELKRRNVIRAGVTYVVAAWVLLQVVDLIAPTLNWSDSATRVTLYALLIGFPIALVLSWFYQITPDGISLDENVDSTAPRSQVVDQRFNLIVIALLAAAVILFAYDKWWPQHAEDPSVVVLPFVNMSGLEENEYFSDGLTETLLHVLAQNPDLRVSARTSSFAFKGKNIDVRDIARELGVANILEGSVQRAGDRLRITAQLIRASDGTHLWSAKYDRKIDDIFAIHDEISLFVAEELSRSLLADATPNIPEGISTDNLEAFDLYLHALAEMRVGSFEAMQNAETMLIKALTKDAEFTDAKELLAKNYTDQADSGSMDFDVGLAKTAALYEQVLAEQPENVGARLFFLIEHVYDSLMSGDLGVRLAAIDEFQALVNDAPNNVEARTHFAQLLDANSMIQEAFEQYEIAIELDPLNPFTRHMYAGALSRHRQWGAARDQVRQAIALEPRQPSYAAQLGGISLNVGDAVDYVRQLQRAFELDPLDYEMPYAIAELLFELELFEEGDRYMSMVTATAPDSPAADALRVVRSIRTGDEEQSLPVARQMIRDHADNRRGAWIRAFRHLLLTAVLRNRTRDEMNFVEEYWPEFGDFKNQTVPWEVGLGRAQTLEIWRDLDPGQGVLDRVDSIEQAFATLNLPLSQVAIVHIDVLLLRGDLEGAIEAALTGLYTHSVLQHLNIKDRFATPLYADFVSNPRISAAMERWDDELAQAREDVRRYLAEQESSP